MPEEISSLIPHKPPMLLIDEVVCFTPENSVVKSCITPNNLFLRKDGSLAPEVFCEIIAQSFAVCESKRRKEQNLSIDGGGYLVSVRDFECYKGVHVGDELFTKVLLKDDFMGTRIVEGTVFCKDVLVAKATVYIFMWEGSIPPQGLK